MDEYSEAQTALIEAAEKRGYKLCHKEREYRLDITTSALNYELPEGFHFVNPDEVADVHGKVLTNGNWDPLKIGMFPIIKQNGIHISYIMAF